MIEGYRSDFVFPRVHEKNKFSKEDFDIISEILQCEEFPAEYRNAVISLLRAYCKGLYCDECKGSRRTSSRSGVCVWNNDMPVSLPLNDGPIRSYPTNCPIRKLLVNTEK